VRIGLLTEGGYPYVDGEARLWCDRLVRGLGHHEFDIYALSRSRSQEDEGWVELPPQVRRVITAPLWTVEEEPRPLGRRARRRFKEYYGELAAAICAAGAPGEVLTADADVFADLSEADRFGSALYGLAELAREEGSLAHALRSEAAVGALERACRAPGALRAARTARVPELLAVAAQMERTLRPLSLDWYMDDGLGSVDLCHATSAGPTVLPGLLARHFRGVPLLVTEYGVQLRAHYLASATVSAPERALLAAFHGRLAAETYRQAAVITPGNLHARRWQERCGADRAKLRIVYPGLAEARFADLDGTADRADPHTLVWVGRVEPAKDLPSLLHSLTQIRDAEPRARLRVIGAPADGPEGARHLAHCEALAAQLFPDEAAVSFEELGGPEEPGLAEAYTAGAVVVLSSAVEGFPVSLVEAMFCGRPTVSTDVGAVTEVIGGTGLVVPAGDPGALAQACVALLRDPERCARLGAAARERALELFTVEQNVAAFDAIYLDILAHSPVRQGALDTVGGPRPFTVPAEAYVPGSWTTPPERPTRHAHVPSWAKSEPVAAGKGAAR